MTDPLVHCASGRARGTVTPTPAGQVERFAGLPYALAPTGQRRFRAPLPITAWDGEVHATEFGPAAVQAVDDRFGALVPGMGVDAVAEDCLTVNIWRPARPDPRPRPVMVWVHGGAFVTGSGRTPTYDGARLAAEQDMIVVSLNYRLGILGFLDLRTIEGGETTDTNCGVRDVLAALGWIAANIADFGGDPGAVTIFGESAGAGLILHLLMTEQIDGLVQRAIVQSPGIDFTQSPTVAAEVARRVGDIAGAPTVEALRNVAATEIARVQNEVAATLLFDVGTMPFHPVVDDELIGAAPSTGLARRAGQLALLIGSTTDEMRLLRDPRADALDDDGLTRWTHDFLTRRLGGEPEVDRAAAIVADQRAAAAGTRRARGSDVWAAIQTDGIMREPMLRLAEQRPGPAPTFVYQFAWQARDGAADRGAFHAVELPFLFDTFHVDGWETFLGADDRAHDLGRRLRSAWAAFARHGDPTCPATGNWPPYHPDRHVMVFDEHTALAVDPLAAVRQRWAGLASANGRPPVVPR